MSECPVAYVVAYEAEDGSTSLYAFPSYLEAFRNILTEIIKELGFSEDEAPIVRETIEECQATLNNPKATKDDLWPVIRNYFDYYEPGWTVTVDVVALPWMKEATK